MLTKKLAVLALIGGVCPVAVGAWAQDADVKPHVPLQKTIGVVTPTGPVPSLFVLNSAGAKLEGTTLTMTGVSMNSIVFADRPVRAAGHVTTEQFIMQWDKGKGSFGDDPPNATISVLGGNGSKVDDAVVTIMNPKLEGGTLTFEAAVLEGSLSGGSGPAALFIDRGGFGGGGFGGGGFGGGFHGGFGEGDFHGGYAGGDRMGDVHVNDVHANYWHAPDYHGAWYAGAGLATGVAVGAAATLPYRYGYGSPYYNGYGPCGYYPNPPCY
ncbi:MAG: hypothetical protein AAAB35_17180 [Phyllobacterium sp.]|uniref:hypothetical protein n=1 Tax=Phyllobacterium sp. TaxID=1871046 RepID=UPI0030F004E8